MLPDPGRPVLSVRLQRRGCESQSEPHLRQPAAQTGSAASDATDQRRAEVRSKRPTELCNVCFLGVFFYARQSSSPSSPSCRPQHEAQHLPGYGRGLSPVQEVVL